MSPCGEIAIDGRVDSPDRYHVVVRSFLRTAPAFLGALLVACATVAPPREPDIVWVRNDAHSPLTVEASPSGEQMTVAPCSTVVLTLEHSGWRMNIDGRHAYSHAELDASHVKRADRYVRIAVSSNDLRTAVRVGDTPEPGIIAACADI